MVYCFLGCLFKDLFSITLKEFSRLHYCSIIKVLSCFCCCCLRQLCYINTALCRCQQLFYFLKTFHFSNFSVASVFVFCCLAATLIYYHIVSHLVNNFFKNFFVLFPLFQRRLLKLNTVFRFCCCRVQQPWIIYPLCRKKSTLFFNFFPKRHFNQNTQLNFLFLCILHSISSVFSFLNFFGVLFCFL